MTITTEDPDHPCDGGTVFGNRSNVLTRLLALNRPLVMGVLNITPDSFSDGGKFIEPETAVEHAKRLIAEGADIIDIGAESTRPYGGAKPVALEEELTRLHHVMPTVIQLGTPVSIDTIKPPVAHWALDQGASIVNDVWGLQHDSNMARVVAEHRAPVVIMHNRNTVDSGIDIISDINAFFSHSLNLATKAGIPQDAIVLDPGIGFGKTPEQSIETLAKIATFKQFGMPILVGASRKRFIDTISPAAPMKRIGGSLAAHLLAVQSGANIIRCHDVAETVQALRVDAALRSVK